VSKPIVSVEEEYVRGLLETHPGLTQEEALEMLKALQADEEEFLQGTLETYPGLTREKAWDMLLAFGYGLIVPRSAPSTNHLSHRPGSSASRRNASTSRQSRRPKS
jgi:hypothetical protein